MYFDIFRSILLSAAAVLFLLPSATSIGAEAERTYDLRPRLDNALREVTGVLEARGELMLRQNGKPADKEVQRLPLEVRGEVRFAERVLDPAVSRSVRYYDEANAKIRIGEGGVKPRLRSARRLIVAQHNEGLRYRAGAGPLDREELDLLRVQGDPLVIAQLMPTEPKAIGHEWTADDLAWARLLVIDTVAKNEVVLHLTKVEGEIALIGFEGRIDGAVGGVATELRLRGKINFDLAAGETTWLAMTIKEKRAIGLAEPGVEASSRLRVAVRRIEAKPELAPAMLAAVPLDEIEQSASILEFRSKQLGFRLVHEPRWRLMLQRPDFAVFRLVEDGELIAQANIARLTARPPEKPLKMVEFQRDIQSSLDKNFGQFVETTEFRTEQGADALRVTVLGAVDSAPIQWVYYHLNNSAGERLTISFTMDAKQAERFGAADRTLINSIQIQSLPTPRTASAGR